MVLRHVAEIPLEQQQVQEHLQAEHADQFWDIQKYELLKPHSK
jgi:hypothetical protein